MTGEFTIAVHALVYLNHKGMIVSSEELAENICTNPARVRKIMSKLRKAHLITTKEGNVGGYKFLGNPAEMNLRQVFSAVEQCVVKPAWKSGDLHMDCLIASGMAPIMEEITFQLDDLCKQRLESITIADIDGRIFD